MKGFAKAMKRTPHLMTSKIGMAAKSSDPAFDSLNQRFTSLEKLSEKLLKDASTFRDAVRDMLLSGANFGRHFDTLFRPLGSEYDLERKHPNAGHTMTNLPAYGQLMDELKETLTPELELVESRVLAPTKDFQVIIKAIRKNITKRDHKLVDYDRHNNSYSKLRDKKEKSLKDEQNLFKVEQDYETAAADYEYYNNALKEEMPKFFELAGAFMTPLFHSFYYMQLNVFYLTMERLQSFAEGKYDLSNNSIAVVEDTYMNQLTDASERLENLTIRRGAVPSAKILAQNRASGGSGGLSPSGSRFSGLAAGAPGRSGSILSSHSPSAAAAPPAYAPTSASTGVVGKRAPPPPPTKPKPGMSPSKTFVVALYDYTATADGDLTFKAGDRIEVTERTASTEDWWTGVVNGQKGVFPGNYVRDE
ncbi:related to RVS167 - BAR adaptor protein [Melanopsichium pennsylvanicum]|uniref:Related to RVS167 - BAR adaptor protein n=2 Tax=Melanopsichium pennsylvanicum TaxID=63383 RepID=A0AAJ4XL67_9BASI|nr:related to RVS167-BAR adaptor protein [Melanopsichium pennsylvanicum 4]SNX83123.1 related to RVS167 - BAR adaptor protein [Melanopsichium pennsylvanicum]